MLWGRCRDNREIAGIDVVDVAVFRPDKVLAEVLELGVEAMPKLRGITWWQT